MSQIYKRSSGGVVPPQIPTEFETQDGTAVPDANILIINGEFSEENNDNGIITKGGTPATPNSNEVDIVLTNRLQGTGQTVGAVNDDIVTFVPTAIGTYSFEFRISAYNTTSTLGAGYSLFGTIRFDGANSNLCGTADTIDNEEGGMTACDINLVVSGANAILRSTGYAAQTINWGAVGLYTYIGA